MRLDSGSAEWRLVPQDPHVSVVVRRGNFRIL